MIVRVLSLTNGSVRLPVADVVRELVSRLVGLLFRVALEFAAELLEWFGEVAAVGLEGTGTPAVGAAGEGRERARRSGRAGRAGPGGGRGRARRPGNRR